MSESDMTDLLADDPDPEHDEPDAEDYDDLPDAEPLDEDDDWVPPRVPDFEEEPDGTD